MFTKKAEVLKAVSNPQRLCIVKKLIENDKLCVNDMKDCLGESQPNVSQHISKLKGVGIIKGKREGKNIYYSICDNETVETLKEVIVILFP